MSQRVNAYIKKEFKSLTILGIITALTIGFCVGLWAGVEVLAAKKIKQATRKKTTAVQKVAPPTKNYFYWGAKVTPSATTLSGKTGVAENFDEATNDQLEFAKELGMGVVKANWEARTSVVDNFVNWAAARNLKAVVQLEDPTITDFWAQANYNRAYELAKQVATRYKGKVAYYQLGNEINGACIKPNAIGKAKGDYDEAKWATMREWLKGLSQGVHDGDPAAKKIVTYNWEGTGILELITEAGINFDVIGVNWYSDMGDFGSFDVNGKYWTNMAEYLWSKYRMDVWITEANQHQGTYGASPEGQRDFLNRFADTAYSSPYIKAFLVYQMADEVTKQNTATGHYGIVGLRYEGNRWKLSDKKPAFEGLKNFISSHAGFPK